jgi:nickel-dependent lactate racemase
MVKTLHPLDAIAGSISSANGHEVRLIRMSGAKRAANQGDALVAPESAVIRALAEPLEFPPLAAGIVPGDRVAIALGDTIPRAGEIVRGVVESLQRAGIETDAISIVTTDAKTSQSLLEALGPRAPATPRFEVHDPDDKANLCLVGLNRRQEPLLVNRTIFDADIVLPIGLARVRGSGAFDSLFPQFSDAESIRRHRTPESLTNARGRTEMAHEADEAGWLIGVPLVIEIVPGPGETVAHVIAGEPQAVARQCDELCRRQWSLRSPRQVDLAIATISGGSPSQTWANVGRALAAAEPVLEADGAIAICSNLDAPPGESLGRLIGTTDLEKTERKISHDQGADSWAAWQLARALQRGPVYLLSQLAAEIVEDMGLAPIAEIAELARLAGRHENFVLIEDSQHAMVTVDEGNE